MKNWKSLPTKDFQNIKTHTSKQIYNNDKTLSLRDWEISQS